MAYQSKYLKNVPCVHSRKRVSIDEAMAHVASGELVDCFANTEVVTPCEFVRQLDSGEIQHFCFDGPGQVMGKFIDDVRAGKYI